MTSSCKRLTRANLKALKCKLEAIIDKSDPSKDSTGVAPLYFKKALELFVNVVDNEALIFVDETTDDKPSGAATETLIGFGYEIAHQLGQGRWRLIGDGLFTTSAAMEIVTMVGEANHELEDLVMASYRCAYSA